MLYYVKAVVGASIVLGCSIGIMLSQDLSWYDIRWMVALIMVGLTLPISLLDISSHLLNLVRLSHSPISYYDDLHLRTPLFINFCFQNTNATKIILWSFASVSCFCLFFLLIVVKTVFFSIAQHNQALQIPVVRLLWMVPIYSLDSFLALRFNVISIYITTAREMYEVGYFY
jgi:hypothetical protein